MPRRYKNVKWTFDKVLESAKKYNHIYDWELGDRRAYRASKNRGWFKEVTAHMKKKKEDFCKYCKGPILLKSKGVRPILYCSLECKRAFQYRKIDIIAVQSKIANQETKGICKICGIEFPLKMNRTGTQIFSSNFCSMKCRNVFLYDPSNPDNQERIEKKRQTAREHTRIKQEKIEQARIKKGLPAKLKRKFTTQEERKRARKEVIEKHLNSEKARKRIKEYNQKPEVKAYRNEKIKLYYKTERGSKKRKEYHKKLWAEKGEEIKAKARSPEGRKKILARHHRRKQTDVQYRIIRTLRSRLTSAVKAYKQKGTIFKKGKTLKLLGCSIEFFLQHIEKQFKPGMTWDNHGKETYKTEKKWNIDHIKAIDKFDLSIPEEQQKCFHYTNLQPLWQKDNRQKWNK